MNKNILIIEDDDFLQGLEATKIKKSGFEVFTASNGNDALKLIASNQKIDLILLDLLLPDMNGFEILEKIRQNTNLANTPVIIFSNLNEEKDLKSAEKFHFTEFMVKSNFTLDELAEKITTLIGK
ncbi:MAG: response regulator [bacterium]|nr:response regulator [bacterium]